MRTVSAVAQLSPIFQGLTASFGVRSSSSVAILPFYKGTLGAIRGVAMVWSSLCATCTARRPVIPAGRAHAHKEQGTVLHALDYVKVHSSSFHSMQLVQSVAPVVR